MHLNRFASIALTIVSATFLHAASSPEETLVDQNHFKRARRAIAAKLAQDPNNAHYLYLSSRVKGSFGDIRGATADAEKAVAADPSKFIYHSQLAEYYAYSAQLSSAVKGAVLVHSMKKEIAASLELAPHNADALLVAMMFAFHAPGLAGGDKKKAHAIADEIVQNDPRWGYLAQARLAQEEASDDRIEAFLKRATQMAPGHYRTWQELATFHMTVEKKRNAAESERAGREMLRLDPGQTFGYNALANAYARMQHWADLDAILAQAEKAVPDDLAPLYYAAQGLIEGGQDFPRAQKYLDRYMASEPEGRAPDRGQTRWLLASLYEKSGRTPDAIRELEAAVRMRPDFEPARRDLKRLKRG